MAALFLDIDHSYKSLDQVLSLAKGVTLVCLGLSFSCPGYEVHLGLWGYHTNYMMQQGSILWLPHSKQEFSKSHKCWELGDDIPRGYTMLSEQKLSKRKTEFDTTTKKESSCQMASVCWCRLVHTKGSGISCTYLGHLIFPKWRSLKGRGWE